MSIILDCYLSGIKQVKNYSELINFVDEIQKNEIKHIVKMNIYEYNIFYNTLLLKRENYFNKLTKLN
jgi:hypothetical protein